MCVCGGRRAGSMDKPAAVALWKRCPFLRYVTFHNKNAKVNGPRRRVCGDVARDGLCGARAAAGRAAALTSEPPGGRAGPGRAGWADG